MNRILFLTLLLALFPSCSLFGKKKDDKPEDKRVLCETLKDSFENEQGLALKFLNDLVGQEPLKQMKTEWEDYKSFHEDSLEYFQRQGELISSIKKVLSAKKKSFKQLSSIYGQFYRDLSSMAKDKKVSQAYLSKLIDVDFVKEHQEVFKDFSFNEEGLLAGYFVEVVSDFLNDDLYVRVSRPLVLKVPDEDLRAREIEFRLDKKGSIYLQFRSDLVHQKNNKSLMYFFMSHSHNFESEPQSFYNSLTYFLNGNMRLDAKTRKLYKTLAYNKCSKERKRR